MTDDENIEMDTNYDIKALTADALRGDKAYGQLRTQAGHDWARWQMTIEGLAALRDIVFSQIGERNPRSQNYRDAMQAMLARSKYANYASMRRQERSDCYLLADHIEEVATWYGALTAEDKLRWNHPGTIVKHCPPELLSKDPRHNQPKPARKSKPKQKRIDPETDRLKDILLEVIQYLMRSDRDQASDMAFARELAGRIQRPTEHSDDLDGVFDRDEEAEEATA